MLFTFYNIIYKKSIEDWIVVTGEIANESRKNYTTAVFRLVVFDREHAIGTGFFKISNFRSRGIKNFEVLIFGLHHRFIPKISRCDIMMESGY